MSAEPEDQEDFIARMEALNRLVNEQLAESNQRRSELYEELAKSHRKCLALAKELKAQSEMRLEVTKKLLRVTSDLQTLQSSISGTPETKQALKQASFEMLRRGKAYAAECKELGILSEEGPLAVVATWTEASKELLKMAEKIE